MKVYFNMNDQDQKTFYTGMILLGLLIRGAPIEAVPEMTQHIIDNITKETE
jgi:hypothetical protein